MELVSKKTAGVIFIGGLFMILLFGFFSYQPILTDLVLILGLIVFVLFLHNPKWGIFLIIFLRPSIDRYSERFTINLGKNLHFNAAAIFGVLVVFLLTLFLIKNKKTLKNLPIKKSWLLFLTIAFLSIAISIDKISSLYVMVKIVSIFLIFSSIYILVKKEGDYKTILLAIVFSSIIPFLSASFQLITGTGVGGSEGVESRLFGTFSHPNPFASFALISITVMLFLAIKESDFMKKWSFWLLFLAGTLILEQTYARGAWLAFLIFLFIVTLKKSPKILAGLFITFFVLFIFSESIQNRVQDVYNPPADSSVRWRFKQWGMMYGAYLKKPLTGYGIGTETVVHEREFGPNAGNQFTHNDFLRIALETGMLGFISYSLLLFLTLTKLLLAYLKEKNPLLKDLGLFILALYLGLLSYSLTNNNLNETVTQWTMWGLLGAVFALFELSQNKKINADK